MYTGQVVDGKRNGKGTLRDKRNRRVIYKGGWQNELYSGLGVLNQNGIEYHGNFDCGKKVKNPPKIKFLQNPIPDPKTVKKAPKSSIKPPTIHNASFFQKIKIFKIFPTKFFFNRTAEACTSTAPN